VQLELDEDTFKMPLDVRTMHKQIGDGRDNSGLCHRHCRHCFPLSGENEEHIVPVAICKQVSLALLSGRTFENVHAKKLFRNVQKSRGFLFNQAGKLGSKDLPSLDEAMQKFPGLKALIS